MRSLSPSRMLIGLKPFSHGGSPTASAGSSRPNDPGEFTRCHRSDGPSPAAASRPRWGLTGHCQRPRPGTRRRCPARPRRDSAPNAWAQDLPPVACLPAGKAPMNDRDAEVGRPLAMLGRRRGGRELSEMTVHPKNIVDGGGDWSQAASSHPVESGKRRGKSRALAILFGRPVRIDSSSRAVPMPGSQGST